MKSTLSSRLKVALDASGLKKIDLSRRCGVSSGAVTMWFDGSTNELKGENLIKAATALGVSPGWLSGQESDMHANIVSEQRVNYSVGINVSVLDASASMGTGKAQPENDTVVGSIQLNPAWVKQRLPSISSPSNLAVLTAYGDSMEPTFCDGDMLLVDRGVLDVKLDAVYVLAFNHELFIKRIQRRMNGDVVIKSDNQLYDPHVVENGDRELLQVLGRVVWAWNGRKL